MRWTILFFAATQIAAGALGEKGKAAKSKLATPPLLASADPLTSADFCEGDVMGTNTIFPMSPKYTITYLKKKTIVFVCVSYFGSRHLYLPLVFNRSAWKKRVNRAS